MIRYIFKSTSGSFCRTLGRIFAYIVVAILIILFCNFINISNVSAATISPYGVTINNSELPVTLGASTTGNRYYLRALTRSAYFDYKYAVLTICSNVGLSVSVYNPSYNYYFNDESYLSNTGKSCTTQGYSGSSYNLYLSVGNWDVGNGNSSYYQASSYLDFKSTWGYNGYMTIQDFVFSDEDLSLLIQKEDKLNSSINDLNNTQQETNNKLNDLNNTQIETNSKLNDLNNTQKETNSKIDETNDFLKDDTAPSSDISALGNVQGLLPPGPVDSLLNIPFEFLSILTSSMSGTCVPLESSFVFDSTLSYPCFSEMFYDNVPELLMVFINVIPSAFILIVYFKHLYKKVDRAVSMESTADDEWGVI